MKEMEWLPRDLERERYSQVHGTCPFKKEYINKRRQSAWNIKKWDLESQKDWKCPELCGEQKTLCSIQGYRADPF